MQLWTRSQTLPRWALALAALPLVIAACSTTPGLTLTLDPPAPGIERGQSGDVVVTVTGTGFRGEVALSASGQAAGVTVAFDPPTVTVGGSGLRSLATSTATITVDDTVAAGDSTLTIRAEGGGLTEARQLTLTVTDSPIVDSVSIQGYGGSSQVRQGAGDITLEITGEKLAGITLASLGSIVGTVLANDDVSASIRFTIPNAESVGPKNLGVATDTGLTRRASVVTVTAITSAPTGDDGTGLGTPDSPFRSLTRAVSGAADGASIVLLDGTYDPANGETFPLDISGIDLSGGSEAGTILDVGAGGTDVLDVNAGTTAIRDLTVQGPGFDGLDIDGGAVTVDNVTVQGMDDGGVDIGGGTVTLTDLTATGNQFGVEIAGGATVDATGFTLQDNDCYGILIGQENVPDSGGNQVELSAGTVDGNGVPGSCNGLYAIGADNVVSVDSVIFDSNDVTGLKFTSRDGSLTVTDSTFTNNGLDGIQISSSPASVNLGDATTAGNNTMTGNGGFQLNDLRAAGETTVIAAHGNDLGGGAPPTGIKEGVGSDANRWNIAGAGNQIDFGP